MNGADELLQLPIRPYDGSLAAQIAVLDLLSARLALLPSRTRWPARIPLTSKASFVGEVVHTNTVKVHLGGEWWVEMTATEAADYITRRKTALLEHHARMVDGAPADAKLLKRAPSPPGKSSGVEFDPLFHPAMFSTGSATTEEPGAKAEEMRRAHPSNASPLVSSTSSIAPQVLGRENLERKSVESQASIGASATTAKPQTLEDLVEQFMDTQRALQASSGKSKGREISTADDSLVNEEGLPIHEIRENPDGSLIGTMPEGGQSSAEIEEVSQAGDDDYWSEEAKKRREALRRRIFHDGEDDSSEEENNGDEVEFAAAKASDQQMVTKPAVTSGRTGDGPLQQEKNVLSPVQEEGSRQHTHSESSPQTGPSALPAKPSSLTVPARSILKTPARKKSVSFDDLVPLPPESPDGARTTMGFPLPTNATTITDEFEPRPVPLLSAPKPPTKESNGFAGFKRGFLSDGTAARQGPDANTESEPQSAKKPSLFAQRLASQAVKESAPPPAAKTSVEAPAPPQASTPKPNLPKMSEHQMNYMKPAVVEKTGPIQGKTALRPEDVKIVERDMSASVDPKPEGLRGLSSRVGERSSIQPVQDEGKLEPIHTMDEGETNIQTEYDDGDEDDDDDSFYDDPDDDEDEDEYDLDDALLAREMALEYHRRHAYRSMSSIQDPDDPTMAMGEDDDGEDEVSGGPNGDHVAGNVMLALPQVDDSGQPMIVNPTPDDVKRFLRVGRLENGNLVLAAGERGWSDEEDDGNDGEGPTGQAAEDADDKQVRRARREDIKRQLLGQPPLTPAAGGRQVYDDLKKAAIAPSRQTEQERTDVPPRLVTEEEEPRSTGGIGDVREKGTVEPAANTGLSDAPKKVSRFKQARMG